MAGARILVIGGYGAVGRHIACRILDIAPTATRVTIAGRSHDSAAAFARMLGPRARSQAIDATDKGAVAKAVAAHDAVILNTEAGSDIVTSASIETATPMISVAASAEILRMIAARHAEARAAGVTIVKDVGLAPGLVQMLAMERLDPPDRETVIELFVELGLIGGHGSEAIRWTLGQADAARSIERVQSPSGARRAIPVDFVDTAGFARKIGAGTVRSYLVLVPHWATGPVFRLASFLRPRAGLVHRMGQPIARLCRIMAIPTDQVRLAARRIGPDGAASVVFKGSEQSRMTGYLAAETALRLMTGGHPPGVIDMADILTLDDIAPALRLFDAKITDDERGPSC